MARELFLSAFIVLIFIFLGAISDTFLTARNIQNLVRANSIYGMMALGMMIVIATGHVDVSVGPTMVAAAAISSKLAILTRPDAHFLNPALAFAVAALVGLGIGLVNGFFVAYCKIPSLIVTLGTYSILRGGICLFTEARWITGYPGWFIIFANTRVLGIYIGIWIWVVLTALTYFIMNRTNLGRRLLAVGGNSSAAQRLGINCERHVVFAFVYTSVLTSIASILFFSQTGMLDPLLGRGYEMTVIAAVIIGGTLLSGGVSSTSGTVLGVLVLGVINSLLVFAHIPVYWHRLVTGVLLLVAILASYIRRNEKQDRSTIQFKFDHGANG